MCSFAAGQYLSSYIIQREELGLGTDYSAWKAVVIPAGANPGAQNVCFSKIITGKKQKRKFNSLVPRVGTHNLSEDTEKSSRNRLTASERDYPPTWNAFIIPAMSQRESRSMNCLEIASKAKQHD